MYTNIKYKQNILKKYWLGCLQFIGVKRPSGCHFGTLKRAVCLKEKGKRLSLSEKKVWSGSEGLLCLAALHTRKNVRLPSKLLVHNPKDTRELWTTEGKVLMGVERYRQAGRDIEKDSNL